MRELLRRFRDRRETGQVKIVWCETPWASTTSPHHLRLVAPGEEPAPGGGLHATTLCGRDLAGGWDLRDLTPPELNTHHVTVNPPCRPCVDKARALTNQGDHNV